MIEFCGKPMIAYPLEAARESGLFDTIHVSTESERYAGIVRDLGFEVDFLRDPSLANDDASLPGVLRWVVRTFTAQGRHFDDVCLIYATAALIEAEDLNGGYALFVEHGRRVPVLAVTAFPAPVERSLKVGEAGTLQPLFPDKWPLRSQDLAVAYHDAGTFFFIGAERLVGDTVKVYRDMLPYVLPRHRAVDIDEPEDLAFAEVVYRGSVKSIDDA